MIFARLLLAAILSAAAAATASAQGSEARVLVVPFENTRHEPTLAWLAEASAVVLADELIARGVPAFTRAERVRAFEQLHLPLSATLSRATVIKVGQMVGATEVIGGTYSVTDGQLSVEARAIRVDVGRLQPHVAERGALADLFAVFERVARRLADGQPRGSAAPAQPPLTAFESFIKGLLAATPATQITFFETALKEYPAFDRARLALWDVRYEQGEHDAALTIIKEVPRDSPVARRAQMRAGISMLELGRFADASAAFTRLLDPHVLKTTSPAASEFAPVLNNLGVVELRRGANASAGSAAYYFTRAADADPADPAYQFNLGYAYLIDRNYKAALYWLREAVRREVADADAHHLLAIALQASGSTVEAAREQELARLLSSRYEGADKRLTIDKPGLPDGLERLRTDLLGPGVPKADQTMTTTAQRDQQELAAFHLDRGRRLFEREQDRDAVVELRRAVYLSPYNAEAHLLIGQIYLRASRPEQAVDALKISIWSEDTAEARVALAETYLFQKNTAAARAELDRALALDPSSDHAKQLLGTIK